MEAQSSDGPTDETGDVSSLDALLGAIDAADSFLRYSQEALRTQSASETAVDPTNESETAADPTVESPTAAIPAPQSRTESRGSLLRRLRRTSDEANLWSESHQPQQEQTPASGQNGIEDSLENFLSDLMDASDDGNPKSSHRQTDDGKPSPPKRRVRHKSKGPRPTCIEDGACDPSYFRSQEDFENFWISGLEKALVAANRERLLRRTPQPRLEATPSNPFTRSLTTGLSSFISDARQRTREGAKISARLKELSQLSTGAPKSAPKRAPKRRAKAAGAKAGPSRAATADRKSVV